MNNFQQLVFRGLSIAIAAIVVAAFLVPRANAVVISWSGSALAGTGTSAISNVGTLVEAHNNGLDAAAIMAGGVLFDAVEGCTADAVCPESALPFGFAGANPEKIAGDANFDAILDTGAYGSGGLNNAIAHEIDGLIIGNHYLVQFFYNDNRACCVTRTSTVDDGDGGTETSGPAGLGYQITGLFAATDTSQIVIHDGDVVPEFHAWQLRETAVVPIPAALPLLVTSLAGLALFARRRKQAV